ncbi:MAG: hypothetical protein DME26_17950, partial [Verrucomicrobia bacterium]
HNAETIADIAAKYAKYNGRRKPELLEAGTFSLENYCEADRVLTEWTVITEQAEGIYAKLPNSARDAFYELVLYPTKASAMVNELYIAAAKNRFYAARGDPRANEFARQTRELFRQDAELSDYYNHKLANGKWNHMMDQTHIGYTGWQQPDSNAIPSVLEVANSTPPERVAESSAPKAQPAKLTAPRRSLGSVDGPRTDALSHDDFSGDGEERDAAAGFSSPGISDVADQHWRRGGDADFIAVLKLQS